MSAKNKATRNVIKPPYKSQRDDDCKEVGEAAIDASDSLKLQGKARYPEKAVAGKH
jgi:hypothetical protein